MLKKAVLYGLLLLIVVACSDYQKVLKSPNPELKYQRAIEYYDNEDYYKSLPLFEELIPLFRGTEKGQEVYYRYCYVNYHLGYLLAAGYHFKKYAETYPLSKYAEECFFMSAYCNYLDSPSPTLDQSPTYRALEELQVFVTNYPESPLVDSANGLVDQLRSKLETKAYLNARQYYKIRQYKAAITALNNVMLEYPDTDYAEEVKFLILQSYYYLAINSIESKKGERFDEGVIAYYDFIDNFADSKKTKEAEAIFRDIRREKEKLNFPYGKSNPSE